MVVSGQTVLMYAGNRRTLAFTVTNEDTPGSSGLSLSGRTAKFAIARVSSDGNVITTPVVEKKSTDAAQIAITDSPNGKLEVYLIESDTSNLLGEFYFELEVFQTSDTTQHVVVATGTLTILANVVNT